ncbi:uncharacterized protein VICG_00008 [Vittaforma corneae ATCC 50505]|uniref:Uncharacterized protein n=1 Tax=Vittaforma corneae (strain ATCC 50505) TaxID=993615 RepID=L2GP81_VITCO|nr:uncharacterized protein VICG_00008 [Vittaforma corneae ATCC 50505]ELA42693.1 hypothetical protein VICG_00008 [Vittaforma corneae ATCC 50505]
MGFHKYSKLTFKSILFKFPIKKIALNVCEIRYNLLEIPQKRDHFLKNISYVSVWNLQNHQNLHLE